MLLVFPDLDTLRLAITSGVVPTALSLAPAAGAVDGEGRGWLEPSVSLPRSVQTDLRKLDVQFVKESGAQKLEPLCCWAQLLPLRRLAEPAALSAQAPVLFDLSDAAQLPDLVSEILRLGNDRQSFRYLENGTQTRVLLRVVGPPYYSLLRALEHDGVGPTAYVERAPRVWVALGYTHPLIEQLKPLAGQIVLLQPPRSWTFLDDVAFRDIYDILELALPQGNVRWKEGALERRLLVPLRLVRGGGSDQAELWVLRNHPLEQLDTLVRDADDRLLARLSFAVVEGDNGTPSIIVLRARPSKQALPVLVLDAESFRPYLKLPNLYLPCGSRLGPPLRRDAVRKLLADDPERVTWLYPTGDGRFSPESLNDAAFRPLEHWIDYVLDHDRVQLEAWIGSTRFDFEAFICSEDKPEPVERKKEKVKGKKDRSDADQTGTRADDIDDQPAEEKKSRSGHVQEDFVELPRAQPSELVLRLREAEQKFADLAAPLDAPERQDLWREMALLNTALYDPIDASVCWAHSFWEDDEPTPTRLAAWFDAECQGRHGDMDGTGEGAKKRRGDAKTEIARLLEAEMPTEADLRLLPAYLAWAAATGRGDVPVARIQHFLATHEDKLSVRGFWLAWVSLVQLSRGDILALARARDRLLERLYLNGLNPERDLPTFLRHSGQRAGERFRAVRDRLGSLHELARLWAETEKVQDLFNMDREHHTDAYIDLMFAFGMARLGENAHSDQLLRQAAETLGDHDEVHSFLLQAFAYRVGQVKEGKPHAGSLPPEQLEFLEDMYAEELKRKAQDKEVPTYKERPLISPTYLIEKLREKSAILDPHEKFDAYQRLKASIKESIESKIAVLAATADRDKLKGHVAALLKEQRDPRSRAIVILSALRIAPRMGEAIATELLEQAPALLDDLPCANDPQILVDLVAPLLECGVVAAAHYDRLDLVREFSGRFVALFELLYNARSIDKLGPLLQQWFRGLRKFGLRDEMDRWLQQMDRVIRRDQDLPTVRDRLGTNWPSALTTLLHIAAGWFYFDRNEQAFAVLNAARDQLFTKDTPMREKKALAVAYCTCLGLAPVELAIPRFEEFFLKVGRIMDPFTTNRRYSLSQLEVTEAVVLAVASDDFTLGSEMRRWLEDDEFLVRRRIHRDLKAFMNQAGM